MNWLRDKKNIALFLLSVAVVFLLVYVLFNNRRGTSEPTATTTASTASTAVDPSGSASTGGTTSDPAASGLPAASDPSTPSATVNSPSGGQAAVNTGTGTIIQINGQGNTVNIDRDGLNAEEEDRLVQLQQRLQADAFAALAVTGGAGEVMRPGAEVELLAPHLEGGAFGRVILRYRDGHALALRGDVRRQRFDGGNPPRLCAERIG